MLAFDLNSFPSFVSHVALSITFVSAAGTLALRMCRNAEPSLRHAIALSSLAAVVSVPLFVACVYSPIVRAAFHLPTSVAVIAERSVVESRLPDAESTELETATTSSRSRPRRTKFSIPGLFATAWAIGVVLSAASVATRRVRQRQYLLRLEHVKDSGILATATKLRSETGVKRHVELLMSRHTPWPFTIGIVRPKIILPYALVRQAKQGDSSELTAALLHELCHVNRCDYAVVLFEQIVGVVVWWNPFVTSLFEELSVAREEICDSHVTHYSGSGEVLAKYLVTSMERVVDPNVMLGVGMSANQPRAVERRIKRLLSGELDLMELPSYLKAIVLSSCIVASIACVQTNYANAQFVLGPAVNLGPILNDETNSGTPTAISDDGLAFYFNFGSDIYVSTRESVNDEWRSPVAVSELNSDGLEFLRFISPDRTWALISQDTAERSQDIFAISRVSADSPWGTPQLIPEPISTAFRDSNPTMTADGLHMLFASERPGTNGGADLYEGTRASLDSEWTVENLGPSINTEFRASHPMMTDDGLMLFFGSDRPGGYGDIDIYMSSRATVNDPWNDPTNLGPNINTPELDNGAVFWEEGNVLFFRSFGHGGQGQDMYMASVVPEPSTTSLALCGVMISAGAIRGRRK
ncbi:MAG: PD40 domain-containing protein [Planctomycetales bacterium]|nr:PD40 domain-containing protein [Planctomycetales bacterium]